MGIGKKLLRFATNKTKELGYHQKAVNRALDIVEESLKICHDSSNPETRISRMGVAIDKLDFLCTEYPYWPDVEMWKRQKSILSNDYLHFVIKNISLFITESIAKIEKLKSQSARHNRAKKLIDKLSQYLQLEPCDKKWLLKQIDLIKRVYPEEGISPSMEDTIPSLWNQEDIRHQIVPTLQENGCPIDKITLSYHPVSWIGKLAIWFVWMMILFPIMKQNEPICLVTSIVLTIGTVKIINKKRKNRQ